MRCILIGLLGLLGGSLTGGAHAQNLGELYRHALDNNPGVKSREFGADQSRAQADQALSRLLPQVSATSGRNWNENRDRIAGGHYYGSRETLQARQALFDLSAYLRLQGTEAQVQQSEKLRDASRAELAVEVVERYLDILQARDELGHLQAEKEATQAQMERLRVMRSRQLAKLTDVLEVEAAYQTLLTREIDARNALAIAHERLRESTGLMPTAIGTLARENFPSFPGTEADWLVDAGNKNPTLSALQHAIDAATKFVKSSRAEHLPQLTLTASRTSADQGFDNRVSPPYRIDSVGIQLTIPIYEGGRVHASVRGAIARLEMAREQLEQSRRSVEREIRTAYQRAAANTARIDSLGAEVRAMEQLLDAQRTGFQLGVGTINEVLVAQRRLFRARADQWKARYDYIRDLMALRMHAGNLEITHVEEISSWFSYRAALEK